MIDCHIHYAASLEDERLNAIISQYKMEGVVLQCIPKGNHMPTNAEALAYKKKSAVPVYVMGGLPREVYGSQEADLPGQLRMELYRLMDMGCTGIKMLEGKPNVRKAYPIPDFDRPVWDGFWDELEREQIPVLFHVNDPEEFWDPFKVTETAKKFGWFYDGSYVNNEDQYAQVLKVLERHPSLRVCFPHFFFMSKQLERLAGILDRYQNVMIDLTPGVELYINLSACSRKSGDFFERYQNRICFGTDIGARQVIADRDVPLSLEESRARVCLIRNFLENDGGYVLNPDSYYHGQPVAMHGLGLPGRIRQKIYHDNILRFLKVI